jgi:hypothetical protein
LLSVTLSSVEGPDQLDGSGDFRALSANAPCLSTRCRFRSGSIAAMFTSEMRVYIRFSPINSIMQVVFSVKYAQHMKTVFQVHDFH